MPKTARTFTDLKPRIDETAVQHVLSLSLWQPASAEAIARIVERCKSNNERKLWGIVDKEQICGIVEFYIRDDAVIYIANIAVIEERRGQGIGGLMLSMLQKKFKLPIELETDDDAVDFYRKCGFEAESFEKNGVRRWRCTLSVANL